METPNKKIRLSGGTRRLIKEKEKAVRGNKSILPFLKSNQEPSLKYSCSEEEDNNLIINIYFHILFLSM
jgi:hypothetical protein